jgi:hypothetical protein
MKKDLFLWIIIGVELLVACYVYFGIFGAPNDKYGLEFIFKGGPLVIVLLLLLMMDITFIVERALSLAKARGTGNTCAAPRSPAPSRSPGKRSGPSKRPPCWRCRCWRRTW